MPTKVDGIAVAQALDHRERDRHGGELRDVVEHDLEPSGRRPARRSRRRRRTGRHRRCPCSRTAAASRRVGHAERQGVPGQLDRLGNGGDAGAGQQLLGRDAAARRPPPAGPCVRRRRRSSPRRWCPAGRRRRSPRRAGVRQCCGEGGDGPARGRCDRGAGGAEHAAGWIAAGPVTREFAAWRSKCVGGTAPAISSLADVARVVVQQAADGVRLGRHGVQVGLRHAVRGEPHVDAEPGAES